MKSYLTTITLWAITVALAFCCQYLKSTPVIGTIENIHGIPFTLTENATQITEQLAHADIHLNHPTLAQKATLAVTFTPNQLQSLSVGIRENPFWLSYTKHNLYQSNQDQSGNQTKTITIPLTDKLQDTNQSLDLMFFAEPTTPNADTIDSGINDITLWQLNNLEITTSYQTPTLPQLKDFIRAIITQERPL